MYVVAGISSGSRVPDHCLYDTLRDDMIENRDHLPHQALSGPRKGTSIREQHTRVLI